MECNKLVIPGCYIYSHKVTQADIIIDDENPTLIEGTVLDNENNIVANAGIEIIQIKKSSGKEKTLGCIFTDIYGKYAFTLNIDSKCYYKFKLYSTI